jgi:hypothetical protein
VEEQPNSSWPQPLTFGGVAAIARAYRGRLLLFQTGVALLAALTLVLFFERAWVPVLVQTIQGLPTKGAIENAQLTWTRPTPLRISTSTFLWISIDPANALEPSEGADLEIELRQHEIRFRSLLGFRAVPYPDGYTIAVNRNEIEPWWGAWHPAVTAALGTGVFAGLFGIWGLLAALYAWPVRLIAFYADRSLSWLGAWRLSLAALLPGGLFFTLAWAAYSLRQLSLLQLLAAGVLHIMVGWIYILFAPFCLPRATDAAINGNVFKSPASSGPQVEPENPFAAPPDSKDQ